MQNDSFSEARVPLLPVELTQPDDCSDLLPDTGSDLAQFSIAPVSF
jgi:hypothetical protein